MTRVFSPACIIAMLCCIAVPARADDKPKIAVLGLEAAPSKDTGTVDPATTDVAREITKELRRHARGGVGGFVVAPNSDKELGDEKLLMNCDSERADCMAVIGAGLAANYLLYGRVEKKGESYRVSLKLLDVAQRTVEPASGELQDTRNVSALANKLYGKLIGNAAELVVHANAERGKVFIDEDYKAKLEKGTAKIQGLSDGRHTLAIEAAGYERYESKIVIEHNEQTVFSATMVEKETNGGGTSGTWHGWSTVFWTTAGLATASVIAQAAFAIDATVQGPKAKTPAGAEFADQRPQNAKLDDSDCSGFSGKRDDQIFKTGMLDASSRTALDRACRDNALALWGFVPTGVFVVAAVFSLYKWQAGDSESSTQTAKHAKSDVDYTLAPLVTATGNGMSLVVTW